MGFLILLVEGKDAAADESSRSCCMAGVVDTFTTRSSLRNKENWNPYNKVVRNNPCQHPC